MRNSTEVATRHQVWETRPPKAAANKRTARAWTSKKGAESQGGDGIEQGREGIRDTPPNLRPQTQRNCHQRPPHTLQGTSQQHITAGPRGEEGGDARRGRKHRGKKNGMYECMPP